MYFVVEGEYEVQLQTGAIRLGAGHFFGELALLTGEPRNATIRARSDVEVIEMNRAGFTELFRTHPDAAAQMSDIIAARLSQRRERLDAGQQTDGGARGRSIWLLAKMRQIFDI